MPQPSDLARLEKAWGGPVPGEEATDFLRLPAAKRDVAIERVAAVRSLTDCPRPSRAEQEAVAERLGIGLKRLQGLMRDWTSSPSVRTVVPHARPAARRGSPRPGVEIAERIVEKALARDRAAAEPTLHRRIADLCRRLGIDPPARMTVRRILDARRRALPFDFSVLEGRVAPETSVRQPRSGESLLLTTVGFRLHLADPVSGPRQAGAVVLADVGSGLVFAVDDRARPDDLGRTVSDTLAEAGPAIVAGWRRPRILRLALPDDAAEGGWNEVAHRTLGAGLEVERELKRRARRMVATLLWRGGEWPEVARDTTEDGISADWPTVTPDEFSRMLERAVEAHAEATDRMLDELPAPQPEGGEVEAAVRVLRTMLG